jgi:dynein heavy chain
MCVHIHHTVSVYSKKFYDELRRHNYTTPTSYLELITLYTTMLSEQRELLRGKA